MSPTGSSVSHDSLFAMAVAMVKATRDDKWLQLPYMSPRGLRVEVDDRVRLAEVGGTEG